MLDQLVESNDHSTANKRRGGFLISTFFVVCTVFLSGILWSLFAKDLRMNAGNLEISELVAPLSITENEPPPPEIQPKREKQAAPNAEMRTKIVQDINEAPNETPDKISVEKSNVPPRNPNKLTVLGRDNIISADAADADYKGAVKTDGTGIGIGDRNGSSTGDGNVIAAKVPTAPPPFVKKEEVKKPTKISLGVVNGKATNLVKPPYPAAARAIRAAGTVNVQVTIDERGNVVAANALDGHPLLRQSAENAARASKFQPTTLSKEPVKVSGVIVYKFTAQ